MDGRRNPGKVRHHEDPWLPKHDAAKATLERARLQVKGVMQIVQNIEQLRESTAQSDSHKTTLQYAPLVVLPLKKTIMDGHPYLQWITPLPVEWLVERDWWIQTHWEDNDCRMIYRNLVACPILRDMISTARLYPGGRVKLIELKAIPPMRDPPMDVTIENCAVMLHHLQGRLLLPQGPRVARRVSLR